MEERLIPSIIHTVWCGDPAKEPGRYRELRYLMRKLHPDWRCMHWDDTALESIAPHLSSINEPVLRSDLLRVAVVAELGGIYVDSDMHFMRPMDYALRNRHGFVLQEPTITHVGSVAPDNVRIGNCVFGAEASDPTLRLLLDELYWRVTSKVTKRTMTMTGPIYWTQRRLLFQMGGFDELPCETFAPYRGQQRRMIDNANPQNVPPNCYAVHEFGGSWRTDGANIFLAEQA